jgi:hypothetical protein
MRARDLVGRTIVAVDFGRWYDGKRHEWITDPVLTLDNGREMGFVVLETDCGEYGVSIALTPPPKKGGKP